MLFLGHKYHFRCIFGAGKGFLGTKIKTLEGNLFGIREYSDARICGLVAAAAH